jgi:hypothetical protein
MYVCALLDFERKYNKANAELKATRFAFNNNNGPIIPAAFTFATDCTALQFLAAPTLRVLFSSPRLFLVEHHNVTISDL